MATILLEFLLTTGSEMTTSREEWLILAGEDRRTLQFAPPKIRGDRGIVMVAVKTYGCVLEYVSRSLQDDREVGYVVRFCVFICVISLDVSKIYIDLPRMCQKCTRSRPHARPRAATSCRGPCCAPAPPHWYWLSPPLFFDFLLMNI